MNKYSVSCPGCGGIYIDEIVKGFKKLIHPGYRYGDPEPQLPSPNCVPSYNYVEFQDCKHCCPETFGRCPDCFKGVPTKKPC